MSPEEKTVRTIFEEVWNKGNVALIDELYTPDFVFHDPNLPGDLSRDGLKGYVVSTRKIFPDFHLTMEDLIAEGEQVADRWTFTGTYHGLVPPPPGIHVRVQGFAIVRFAGGKVAEQWHQGDQLGLLQQLGLYPKEHVGLVAV